MASRAPHRSTGYRATANPARRTAVGSAGGVHVSNRAAARAAGAPEQALRTEHLGNRAVARVLAGADLHRAPSSPGEPELTADLARRIDARRSSGAPLPADVRVPMQDHLGTDLGAVRVHTDAAAADLSRDLAAEAFTSGQDIFFAAGRYSPQSAAGRELLAHEAVHVAQAAAGLPPSGAARVSRPSDATEVEARAHAPALARAVASARPAAPTPEATTAPARADHGLHRSPTPDAPAQDVGVTLAVAALEALRHDATTLTFLAGAYAGRGIQTVDALRAAAVGASDTYTRAYESYAGVVAAAGAEARNQQDWIDIFVGIGIGVGVGLLGAAIVPEGLALGWTILAETAGEATEAVVAGAVGSTGITSVAGTDLQPGGLDPHVLSTAVWRNLAQLYRGVLGVQTHTQYLPLLLGTTEYALGQLRLVSAGVPADMTSSEIVDMAAELNRSSAHVRALSAELTTRLAALDELREQAAAVPRRGTSEVERDVWVMWMATVPDGQSDVLDLDAIEDRLAAIGLLGPGGILGVDFGAWTSGDDERAALAAARGEARSVRARYDALR